MKVKKNEDGLLEIIVCEINESENLTARQIAEPSLTLLPGTTKGREPHYAYVSR